MKAAFGRLHRVGRAASGGPPILVEGIMRDEMCIQYVTFVYLVLDYWPPFYGGVIIQEGGLLIYGGLIILHIPSIWAHIDVLYDSFLSMVLYTI